MKEAGKTKTKRLGKKKISMKMNRTVQEKRRERQDRKQHGRLKQKTRNNDELRNEK